MLRADVALIGGTGIGSKLSAMGGRKILVPTREGAMRGVHSIVDGVSYVFVQRHSRGHAVPPHAVSYGAIALGVSALGVKGCLSTAAVGSLRPDWGVGTLSVCTDMIDFSSRNVTLFSRDVRHTDLSNAFPLAPFLCEAVGESKSPCVYANVNGPRYETPSEITHFRRSGADVVGMTVGTEATLMREAGVRYGCLAIVTNLGCGLGETEPKHEDVSKVVASKSNEVVQALLKAGRTLLGAK